MALPKAKDDALAARLAALPVPSGKGWLAAARNEALVRLTTMGLPARRDEYWRYTDPASLNAPESPVAHSFDASDEAAPFDAMDRLKIVFVDGVFDPKASDDLTLSGVSIERLAEAGAKDGQVSLRRAGERSLDVNALRKDLTEELQRSLVAQVQANDARVRQLQADVSQALAATAQRGPETTGLDAEIRAQLPQVRAAWLGQVLAPAAAADAASAPAAPAMLAVSVERPLSAPERERLSAWLAVRLARPEVLVVDHIVRPPPRRN
jgi:hypothetical protein